jgi:glucose/arabinose dehydrogenase
MPARRFALVTCFALTVAAAGCFRTSPSRGGGQVKALEKAGPNPADVLVPAGYRLEVVATGLTFPTGVAFDDQGRPHVTEAGYSYGEVWAHPRLVRIEAGGSLTPVVASGPGAPWNGVAFHGGQFYVGAGGHRDGGQILRISPDGKSVEPIVRALPSFGDHHTNGPAVGPDGAIYFGQGTATNSGVVGTDNHKYGWLAKHPELHDVPAKDVKLVGQNFTTDNPLTDDPKDQAVTGAFQPFGTPSEAGQVVKAGMPCTGAVLRIPPGGGNGNDGAPAKLEVVAWGLRNPYGLAFAPDGTLYVTENSYDVRGSRPVYGTGDLLWRVDQPGLWYGWPDFHGGLPLTRKDYFTSPGQPSPQFLLAEHPNPPPRPAAKLGVHSSSNGFDFSRSEAFGHAGQAFVAQFGDMAPDVGKVMSPVGFKVVRVDVNTGVVRDFATNRGKENGPASKLKHRGFERPNAVRFNPAGDALYVVDFGVMTIGADGPEPRQGTGVVWRITQEASR